MNNYHIKTADLKSCHSIVLHRLQGIGFILWPRHYVVYTNESDECFACIYVSVLHECLEIPWNWT